MDQDEKMELSSDGSYEMVDFEECCQVLTDSDEDVSEKSTPQGSATESSDMEAEDSFDTPSIKKIELDMSLLGVESSLLEQGASCILKKDRRSQFKKFVNRMECNSEFPVHFKRKESMEIKDVVKEHVLPFLPAKSLARFRAVSKDWDKWIHSPFLAHKQTYCFRDISGFFCQDGSYKSTFMSLNPYAYGIACSYLTFLPEYVNARSSCNGLLLCQGVTGDYVYFVCNPVNKEWKEVPKPNYYHGTDAAIVLAFEPAELNFSADYDLICAVPIMDHPTLPRLCFEVYSSKNNSWRRADVECFELGGSRLRAGGFCMKGVAYWETLCGHVLAFDMKNEIYGILPLPPSCTSLGALTQMHGELCYVHAHNQTEGAFLIDIYTGMDFSLNQRIALDVGLVGGGVIGKCRALPIVNSDMVMFLVGQSLCCYHLRDQKFEVIRKHGGFGSETTFLPYVNSLVSVGPN